MVADQERFPVGQTAGERVLALIEAAGIDVPFTIRRGRKYEEDTLRRSEMRFGDGPWIPMDSLDMPRRRNPPGDDIDALLYAAGSITVTLDQRPEAEAARLRALGIDLDRVIEGETAQKEIEG